MRFAKAVVCATTVTERPFGTAVDAVGATEQENALTVRESDNLKSWRWAEKTIHFAGAVMATVLAVCAVEAGDTAP